MSNVPEWVVFHVPHSSLAIPTAIRDQFVLSDVELENELLLMTDHWTQELFTSAVPVKQIIYAQVSRLVVDVERFEDDTVEPMAARGMGMIYENTSTLGKLRRPLADDERQALLDLYYRPHHARLTQAVDEALSKLGECQVLDCHSFPSLPLPYEQQDTTMGSPDICIGTDVFHTPPQLASELRHCFEAMGYTTELNYPFSGSIVPEKHLHLNPKVRSVMVEIRRDLYCDEYTGSQSKHFSKVAHDIRQAVGIAIARWR